MVSKPKLSDATENELALLCLNEMLEGLQRTGQITMNIMVAFNEGQLEAKSALDTVGAILNSLEPVGACLRASGVLRDGQPINSKVFRELRRRKNKKYQELLQRSQPPIERGRGT